MKLIKKPIKNFCECSSCQKLKNTRTLNIRYQSFTKTYKTTQWNKNRSNYWFYCTENYVLCRLCQKRFISKLKKI